MHTKNVGPIADEILAAIDKPSQIATFTERDPSFRIEHAHATLAALCKKRTARGERQVGRKIGFTNRGIWDEYKVYAPIWGNMYDTTVSELSVSPSIAAARFSEPRIEPEIVFKLAKDVGPRMDEAALLDAIEWTTHGFEIVQSVFPGWKFKGVDCFAAEGLHGALLLGPPRKVAALGTDPMQALIDFNVTLSRNGKIMDSGRGANALDSPLSALRHLVDVLDMDPFNPPLRAGEIITTGTLTRAFPVAAGETWSTTIDGIALEGVTVTFV
jgi:2-oxo-3-hexenedioate decarboxylase